MMRKALAALLLVIPVVVFAQTRNDTMIYIPTPTGGNSTQQAFFKENFEMETIAAGYATTNNASESDYVLRLEIRPNMITYDDGTQELAPPEEKQNLLELRLIRNEDNIEIVMFNFPFTDVEEMYEYNLYLLYQAMANVPLTKLTAANEGDHWRNKWLYVRADAGFGLSVFKAVSGEEWSNDNGGYWKNLTNSASQEVGFLPMGTVGVEFQFLNWMSAEADFRLLFSYPDGQAFAPSLGVFLKVPLKPSRHFMLEPYAGANFTMLTGENVVSKSANLFGVGGGFQFGVKGGEMGAFFIDVRYIYDLTKFNTDAYQRRKAEWERNVVAFAIGYKIGFFNRLKDD